MNRDLEAWLEKLNAEFRANDMPHMRRPFEALRRYSMEQRTSIDISSSFAKEIFQWFYANSPRDAHKAGSMYEAIYYFDAHFWRIGILIIYGSVALDARTCLIDMPEPTKASMFADPRITTDYFIYWADCVDYGLGSDDLVKTPGLNDFGKRLFLAGDQELREAASLLAGHRPQSKAAMSCRNATEMFLKSFLALRNSLTENEAKNELGHNLNLAMDQFVECSGYKVWVQVKERLKIFPRVAARYSELSFSHQDLFEGFAFAQSIGVLVAREVSGRDTITQVMNQLN